MSPLNPFGVGRAPPTPLDAAARLLTGPQAAAIRQIGIADSRLAHLARAIRWILSLVAGPERAEFCFAAKVT